MELLLLAVAFGASIVGAICGIGGGMAGRILNKKLSAEQVDKLFVMLIIVIIGISCYNAWRFLG